MEELMRELKKRDDENERKKAKYKQVYVLQCSRGCDRDYEVKGVYWNIERAEKAKKQYEKH